MSYTWRKPRRNTKEEEDDDKSDDDRMSLSSVENELLSSFSGESSDHGWSSDDDRSITSSSMAGDTSSLTHSVASNPVGGGGKVRTNSNATVVYHEVANENEELLNFWTLREQTLKQQDDRKKSKNCDMQTISKAKKKSRIFHNSKGGDKSDNDDFDLIQIQKFEEEKEALREIWRQEFQAELKAEQEAIEAQRWYNRVREKGKEITNFILRRVKNIFLTAETFFSNLPVTVGALAMAWVLMGVVWFKFTEENLKSCIPVHYHSPYCTFPEFPGCFYCSDPQEELYRYALKFHYFCDIVAGVFVFCFVMKVILAWKIMMDELSNPTTSSPCGLILMTTVVIAAGRGNAGRVVVIIASVMHLCLAMKFFLMAKHYRILPDPSWFPNTVGLSYSALKSWLYFPYYGMFLLSVCCCCFLATFPPSIIRTSLNRKISAQVCWIQVSAPSITLYAFTLLSQPTEKEEQRFMQDDGAEQTQFKTFQRQILLPFMHILFVVTIIGALSSVTSLWIRRDTVRNKPFSPAHAAFCFPILSHTNAIQAYRRAILSSSSDIIKSGGEFWMSVLFVYWVLLLLIGSVTTLIISMKYLCHLQSWTQVKVDTETEPPRPNETMISQIIGDTGEMLLRPQPFTNPSVLQANEAGVLIRVRRDSEDWRGPYVRTRQISSVGFEPIMNFSELVEEREQLLEWLANNPPRQRLRTQSTPGGRWSNTYGTMEKIEEGRNLDIERNATTHKKWLSYT